MSLHTMFHPKSGVFIEILSPGNSFCAYRTLVRVSYMHTVTMRNFINWPLMVLS